MSSAPKPRPYIIAPFLLEQATWGGDYIVSYKGWQNVGDLGDAKIGQSYELYGESVLVPDIVDTSDSRFGPDSQVASGAALPLGELIEQAPHQVLGEKVTATTDRMPLLIKFTQARGNSFQLHKRLEDSDAYWQSKPETWYYLEEGLATLGLAPNADVAEYKAACLRIEAEMIRLSGQVRDGAVSVDQARAMAKELISAEDPRQYVNVRRMKKGDVADLSGGGVHHSWEDDPRSQLGNVLYEVQHDVADAVCTVRSFDQGKIADNGTVRPVSIEDYFRLIDTDPVANDVRVVQAEGSQLVTTPTYSLDEFVVDGDHTQATGGSFNHLFVREGTVTVSGGEVSLEVTKGHSCFIPAGMESYVLRSSDRAAVFRTYV